MTNSTQVAILDYGIGNLLSVKRGFDKVGGDAYIVDTPEGILSADRLVIPGVGAFKKGMEALEDSGFIESISNFAETGKPVMGICLGMQLFLSESEEFGAHGGLNFISGKVQAIPMIGADGRKHKIPHIGWNELIFEESNLQCHNILNNVPSGSNAYFVHSYSVVSDDKIHCLAHVDYNGIKIEALIKKDNIYGCQFHPEKSGEVGLTILKNFLQF